MGSRRAAGRAGFRESLQAAMRKGISCFGGKGMVGEGGGREMKRRYQEKKLEISDLTSTTREKQRQEAKGRRQK